jgi:hypothetical protein
MECGDLFGVALFVTLALVSMASKYLSRKQQSVPPSEVEGETPQTGIAAQLREALREVVEEAQTAAPWETPASEHHRTPSEHRRTPGEHRRTPGEHQRTPGEHRRTAGEHQRTPSEHRPTAGEHVAGDAPVTRLPPPPAVRRRGGSDLAAAVRGELRSGRASLARAMVLREILGPPVSMRSGMEDRPP